MPYLKKFRKEVTTGSKAGLMEVKYKEIETFEEVALEHGKEQDEQYFLLTALPEFVTNERIAKTLEKLNGTEAAPF